MQDLFEHPDLWSKQLQELMSTIPEQPDYQDLENVLKQFEAIGYTFEYGLDAVPYNLRRLKKENQLTSQLDLQNEVIKLAGINIVTCGNCGSTLLHRIKQEEIECPDCGFKSEPCDFPDLNYVTGHTIPD